MNHFRFRTLVGFTVLAIALVFAGGDSSEPLSDEQDQKAFDTDSKNISGQYIAVLTDDAVTAKSESGVRSLATELLGKSGQVGATTALKGFSASGVSEQRTRAVAVN